MKKEVLSPRNRRLEYVAIVAALAALVACATAPTPEVYELEPVGDITWSDQVGEAATIWNDAVRCDPFVIGAGLRVKLYDAPSWPGASDERGYYDGAEVAVRETTREVERSTLVHELGHVIGLPHSEDKTSVMYPIVSVTYQPNDDDIALAAALVCP